MIKYVKYISYELFGDFNQNLCIFFQSNMIDKWENVSNVFFLMFLFIFIGIYWFFHDLKSWISEKICQVYFSWSLILNKISKYFIRNIFSSCSHLYIMFDFDKDE